MTIFPIVLHLVVNIFEIKARKHNMEK